MENDYEIVDVSDVYDDVAYAVSERDGSQTYFTDQSDAQAYRDYVRMVRDED